MYASQDFGYSEAERTPVTWIFMRSVEAFGPDFAYPGTLRIPRSRGVGGVVVEFVVTYLQAGRPLVTLH